MSRFKNFFITSLAFVTAFNSLPSAQFNIANFKNRSLQDLIMAGPGAAQAQPRTSEVVSTQELSRKAVIALKEFIFTGYSKHREEFLNTYEKNKSNPDFIQNFRSNLIADGMIKSLGEAYINHIISINPSAPTDVLPKEFCDAISAVYLELKKDVPSRGYIERTYGQSFVSIIVDNSRVLPLAVDIRNSITNLEDLFNKGNEDSKNAFIAAWRLHKSDSYFINEFFVKLSENLEMDRLATAFMRHKNISKENFNGEDFAEAIFNLHQEFRTKALMLNMDRIRSVYGRDFVSLIEPKSLRIVKIKQHDIAAVREKINYIEGKINQIEKYLKSGVKEKDALGREKTVDVYNQKYTYERGGLIIETSAKERIDSWKAELRRLKLAVPSANDKDSINALYSQAVALSSTVPVLESVQMLVRASRNDMKALKRVYNGEKPYTYTITERWISQMEVLFERITQRNGKFKETGVDWIYTAASAGYGYNLQKMRENVQNMQGVLLFLKSAQQNITNINDTQMLEQNKALQDNILPFLSPEFAEAMQQVLSTSMVSIDAFGNGDKTSTEFIKDQIKLMRQALENLPEQFRERVAIQFYSSWHRNLTGIRDYHALAGTNSRAGALEIIVNDQNFIYFRNQVSSNYLIGGTISYQPRAAYGAQNINIGLPVTLSGEEVLNNLRSLSLETQYEIYRLFSVYYPTPDVLNDEALAKLAVIVNSVKDLPQAYAPLLLEKVGRQVFGYDPGTLEVVLQAVARYSSSFVTSGSFRELDDYYQSLPGKLNKLFTNIFATKDQVKEDLRDVRIRVPPENPDFVQLYIPAVQIIIQIPKHVYSRLTTRIGDLPPAIQETSAPAIHTGPATQPNIPDVEKRFFDEPTILAKINVPLPFLLPPLVLQNLHLLAPDYIPPIGEMISLLVGDTLNYGRTQTFDPTSKSTEGFIMNRGKMSPLAWEGGNSTATYDLSKTWQEKGPSGVVSGLNSKFSGITPPDVANLSSTEREFLRDRYYSEVAEDDFTDEQAAESLTRFNGERANLMQNSKREKRQDVGEFKLFNATLPGTGNKNEDDIDPSKILDVEFSDIKEQAKKAMTGDRITGADPTKVIEISQLVNNIIRILNRVKSFPEGAPEHEIEISSKFEPYRKDLESLQKQLNGMIEVNRSTWEKIHQELFGTGRNSMNFDGFVEHSSEEQVPGTEGFSRFDTIRLSLEATAPGGADTAIFFERTFLNETVYRGTVRDLLEKLTDDNYNYQSFLKSLNDSESKILFELILPNMPATTREGWPRVGERLQQFETAVNDLRTNTRSLTPEQLDARVEELAQQYGKERELYKYRAFVFKRTYNGSFTLADIISLTNEETQALYQTIKPEADLAYRGYFQLHPVQGSRDDIAREGELEGAVIWTGEETLSKAEPQGFGAAYQQKKWGAYGLGELTRGGRVGAGTGYFNPEGRWYAVGRLFVSDLEEKEVIRKDGVVENTRGYYVQGTFLESRKLRIDAFVGGRENKGSEGVEFGALVDYMTDNTYFGLGAIKTELAAGGRTYFIDKNLIYYGVMSGIWRKVPKDEMPAEADMPPTENMSNADQLAQVDKEYQLENFAAGGRYGLPFLFMHDWRGGVVFQRHDWAAGFLEATYYADEGVLGLDTWRTFGLGAKKLLPEASDKLPYYNEWLDNRSNSLDENGRSELQQWRDINSELSPEDQVKNLELRFGQEIKNSLPPLMLIGGARISGRDNIKELEAYYPGIGDLKLRFGPLDAVIQGGKVKGVSTGFGTGLRLSLDPATIFGVFDYAEEPFSTSAFERKPMTSKEFMLGGRFRLTPEENERRRWYGIAGASAIMQEFADNNSRQYDFQAGVFGRSFHDSHLITGGLQLWKTEEQKDDEFLGRQIRNSLVISYTYDDLLGFSIGKLELFETFRFQGAFTLGKQVTEDEQRRRNERLLLTLTFNLGGTF